jgi:hypothetical protein
MRIFGADKKVLELFQLRADAGKNRSITFATIINGDGSDRFERSAT